MMPYCLKDPEVDIEEYENNQEWKLDERPIYKKEQRRLVGANLELGKWQQRLLLAEIYDNLGSTKFDLDTWKKKVRSALCCMSSNPEMISFVEYSRMLEFTNIKERENMVMFGPIGDISL
jgi:hypothetical protein